MSAGVVNRTGGIEINGTLLFGMDAEQALKQQAKYDFGLEKACSKWIAEVLKEKLPHPELADSLHSGIILIRLLNTIKPGTIKKYNKRAIALMEIENIKLYLEGCWKLGLPSSNLFVSSDLYKKRDMSAVLQNLVALSKLAATISEFKGPYLQDPSSRSKGGKRKEVKAAKKWDKIEIGGPKFVTDTETMESMDLRGELVKLQQQLEREKFERQSLEEELAELQSKSSTSTKPVVSTPATSKLEANKSSSADKAKITQLTTKISQLENELKKKDATITQLKSELDKIKGNFAEIKKEFQKQQDAQKKQTTTATTKAVMKSAPTTTQSTSNSKDKHELEKLKKEIQSLKQENSGLKSKTAQLTREKENALGQVKQLQTQLQAAQSRLKSSTATPKATTLAPTTNSDSSENVRFRSKTFFKLGDNASQESLPVPTFSANEELQTIERYLTKIFNSEYVDFEDVYQLNNFFKKDAGRRQFTQLLDGILKKAQHRTLELQNDSFELLLYLVNTTLIEMDLSDCTDLITAKVLMRASRVLKRKTEAGEEYIQEFISGYQVWQEAAFWEEKFWDDLFIEHSKKTGDTELLDIDTKLTINLLEQYTSRMSMWNFPREKIITFCSDLGKETQIDQTKLAPFITKISTDKYWSSIEGKKAKKEAKPVKAKPQKQKKDKEVKPKKEKAPKQKKEKAPKQDKKEKPQKEVKQKKEKPPKSDKKEKAQKDDKKEKPTKPDKKEKAPKDDKKDKPQKDANPKKDEPKQSNNSNSNASNKAAKPAGVNSRIAMWEGK